MGLSFSSKKKKKNQSQKRKRKRAVQIWAQFTVSALKGSGLPSLLHLKTEDQVPHQCLEAKGSPSLQHLRKRLSLNLVTAKLEK
jgi:hypothetical protein